MKNLLVRLALLGSVLGASSALAAPFTDNFNTDTSANYTGTDVLKNNTGAGAAVRNIDVGDSNVLAVSNPTRTAGTLQTTFMHNTARLAVGEAVMLDIVGGEQVAFEAIGLAVSRLNPITDMVLTGSSGQQDGRPGSDYVTSSLRLFDDSYQSERWAGTNLGQVTTIGLDPLNVSGVYIQRLAEDVFSVGYLNASGSLVHQGMYENAAFTSDGAFVGVYSDMRSATSTATVDNLRIVAVDTPVLTIDRQTGQVTLSKFGTNDLAILGYQLSSPTSGSFSQTNWLTVSDNYDLTSTGGPGPVDFNDDWTVLTDPDDPTDLSEFNFSTDPGNPGVLSHTAPINLGQVWLRTPFEDVTAKLSLENEVVDVRVVFTGLEIPVGDLTGDGEITAADYAAFLAGQGSDFTGLSEAQAYLLGDLNGDFKHDIFDFVAFENLYDLANGAGALAALVSHSVPEPGSVLLMMLGAVTLLGARRIRLLRSLCVAAVVVGSLLAANTASALVFLDDFSSDTSGNYTPLVGLGQQNGRVPNLTVVDGQLNVSSVGTGQAGSSSATQTYILHETATLGVGERMLLDIKLRTTTDPAYSPFGSSTSELIGLTVMEPGFTGIAGFPASGTADVRDTQVANLHAGFLNRNGRDTFRSHYFNGPDEAGAASERLVDVGVSASATDPGLDSITSVFIARVSANQYDLGWIENGTTPHVVRTEIADLGATPRVGIYADTRNASFNHLVDNFRIEELAPQVLTLRIDPTSGYVKLENQTEAAVSLDSYQITSALGNLNAAGWTSLYDQNLAGFPAGSTPTDPNGWVEVPNPSSTYLAEYFLNDEGVGLSTLAVGASILLGPAYTGAGQLEDLSLVYQDVTTGKTPALVEALIEFGTIDLPSSVPGDYDNNGYVDANDYTTWKAAFGNAVTPGTGADGNSDGIVDAADYTIWRNNLGAGTPPAALLGATAVPEPGSLWMVLGGVAFLSVGLRKRFRVASCLVAALATVFAASTTYAARHLDRNYQLGDDVEEPAVANNPVSVTYDSAGAPMAGNYQDLNSVGGSPTYVDVSSRPFAGSSQLGVQFNGTSDYLALIGGGLGNPRNNPPQNPYDNFAKITTRGIQFWARPDGSTGARQDLVMDTYQFGVHITANDTWGMTWGSNNNSSAGNTVDSGVAVEFGEWTHVMQHSQGPSGAVLLVDGIAIAKMGFNNGVQTYRSHVAGADLDLTLGAGLDQASNHYFGILDDVEIYVAGDNTGVAPVVGSITQPGMNWGTVSLATDNEFIAGTLAGKDVGDVNLDGFVDALDVTDLMNHWNSIKLVGGVPIGDLETRMIGDLDFNGRVDIGDALILHDRLLAFGQGGMDLASLGGHAVPEPTTLVSSTLLLGAMLLLRARHRAT